MCNNPPSPPRPTSPTIKNPRVSWLIVLGLLLWVLQFAWLGWKLREEIGDVPRRLWSHSWGEVIHQEDPFYRWLFQVEQSIPPNATYVFLDNYEAGKEIEARYHLFPRHRLLIRPQAPPSLLFHTLKHHQVSYLLVREVKQAEGSGLKAALAINAAKLQPDSGPGQVFVVHPDRISGGFYD